MHNKQSRLLGDVVLAVGFAEPDLQGNAWSSNQEWIKQENKKPPV